MYAVEPHVSNHAASDHLRWNVLKTKLDLATYFKASEWIVAFALMTKHKAAPRDNLHNFYTLFYSQSVFLNA